jgi:hypothetical protein
MAGGIPGISASAARFYRIRSTPDMCGHISSTPVNSGHAFGVMAG